MKRAVFMLMISWSLALVAASNAAGQNKKETVAPSQKKEASADKQKSSSTASKQKQESNQPTSKTSANAPTSAPNTGTARPENAGSKPIEQPKVKILEITRLDDLHVQLLISVNDTAKQQAVNFNGISGSLNLNAQFANGQLASVGTNFGSDPRRITLELKPFNPVQNDANVGNVLEEKKGGSPSTGGSKTKSGPSPNSQNGTPHLTKVTVKVFFNVKSGNQTTLITDELTRNF